MQSYDKYAAPNELGTSGSQCKENQPCDTCDHLHDRCEDFTFYFKTSAVMDTNVFLTENQ